MSNTPSLRQRFLDLKRNEKMDVSLDDYSYATIQSYACNLGFDSGRKFTCRRNRETRSYTVTRIQ